ncbi:tol-pal system-associated acyl-CoA thioesterase [Thauera linaloolentis]|uniref:Tol-pal system-associated acyl-CoA thioesterase n=1 Tax=Thauera linaloolentis (strain DSM 12138 / JCM 21573 / CCUG 41526 / CIP 105981 / IAM 15112 / NBRC 102519 / 47Lol) TaxID=1123367 RepID=N6Y629_THAL4|nr:tol-pal system-associated acyl-CoA thioesterase [Thauera linaloolentis]ENO89671.1 tol-pal system-associated acyl-CoA thioesterase [Thauera linaloolentis 47Lol = DSM 12138]MCM8567151.1 tol-pal system-associated acyl-CoA thioesterase [Thauera linaloolentis]
MQPKIAAAPRPPEDSPSPAASFILPVRVYYEDTDAAGVVYYANYLRFCERARTEWLRALGVEQHKLLESTGIAFVVRAVKADYLHPARLDDALQVATRIAALRRASLTFDQEIRRGGQLLFTAQVLIACIDHGRQKPAPMPSHLHAHFESLA